MGKYIGAPGYARTLYLKNQNLKKDLKIQKKIRTKDDQVLYSYKKDLHFYSAWVKETDLDTLYTVTIHAIFVIVLSFCLEVNRTHFFTKHFYTSTILDHL
jgi:hypothetical protein